MDISLASLTVSAFRGIPDERTFELDGQNTVVVGPNGTGKSTLFQAIEFLLTGEIAAMRGSGTGGVQPTEHIPNRYADPDDTVVRATFVDDDGERFQAYRRFTNRNKLVAERRPPEFRALLQLADRGLLLLTREELLELVISAPGDRKDQIYELLNTSGIDERRLQLKRLAREADKEADKRRDRQRQAADRLSDIVDGLVTGSSNDDPGTVDTDVLRTAVNQRRDALGGNPVQSITDSSSFRDGLTSPVEQASDPLQRADVQQRLDQLLEWFGDAGSVKQRLQSLREDLRALQADEAALTSLSELALVRDGRSLVDETTTECPLCGRPWDGDELAAHLAEREERLSRIEDRSTSIEQTTDALSRDVDQTRTILERLLENLQDTDTEVDFQPLEAYLDRLDDLQNLLDRDLVDQLGDVDPNQFDLEVADRSTVAALNQLQDRAKSIPDRSALEQAWDELKTLADAYDDWRTARKEAARYDRAADELQTARSEFIAARDTVMDDIFKSVNDRFTEIYRAVNPDEDAFDPTLDQTNTGVELAVDFYGEGEHPPNALHSEGHQDLMGVCLFLALADELSPLGRRPLLLDDVVSVVDARHRERFAHVLDEQLSDSFQFLITTHDDSWAVQLKNAGVADDAATIQFQTWAPDTGPQTST